jgi:hypothetical protein
METIEHLAHIGLVAHQLGSAQPLRTVQIEQLHRAKAKYMQNSVEVPGGERLVEPGRSANEIKASGHIRTKEEIRVFSSRTNRIPSHLTSVPLEYRYRMHSRLTGRIARLCFLRIR